MGVGSGVGITVVARCAFGGMDLRLGYGDSARNKRCERLGSIGEHQGVAGVKKDRSHCQISLLLLLAACRGNNAVHADIFNHLTVMIEAVPCGAGAKSES